MAAVQTFPEMIKILGGKLVLGSVRSEFQLHERIDRGFDYRALEALAKQLGSDAPTLAALLHISESTLRRRAASKRLDASESEKAARLARIAVLGKQALGSYAAALRWLLKPNRGLRNKRPIDLMQNDVGTQQVEAGLGRLLYGGYG